MAENNNDHVGNNAEKNGNKNGNNSGKNNNLNSGKNSNSNTGGNSNNRKRAALKPAAQAKSLPASQEPLSLPGQKKQQSGNNKNIVAKNGNNSNNNSKQRTRRKPAVVERMASIKIMPLGGLSEIGKNITLIEYGPDMILIDCGLAFPDTEMLGVDIVIPDFSFIEKNADKIRGLIITHGHEDHIGAIPYLLKKMNIPVYGTRLTLGLVEGKLKEHGILNNAKLNVAIPRRPFNLGGMSVEMIRVNHSIPDAVAVAIHTPLGTIIHTGDFKVDYTPIQSDIIDLARFSELGNKGVLCLMSDSTNAERPGYTMSEKKVGESFERLFKSAGNRRIIIATFSSNIHRVQQIVDNAVSHGRKVAVSGRSMINVVSKAIELGYLSVPDGILVDIDDIGRYPHEKLTLVTTGSQGEPMSALSRMASGDHGKVNVTAEDFIIISATPIPGNEKHVTKVINELMRLGAKVVYEAMYEVHVSGHACQDELKMMMSLVKPRYFIPVHGEYKHLKKHSELALDMGIEPSNIHLPETGQVIEIDNVDLRVTGTVPSGRVYVDGLGVGDVGSIVLRDRKILSTEGLIIVVLTIENESGCVVSGPDIVSRGFVYVRESEELMHEARTVIIKTLDDCSKKNIREWGMIKNSIKDSLNGFIYRKTKRTPMILPIIMEI